MFKLLNCCSYSVLHNDESDAVTVPKRLKLPIVLQGGKDQADSLLSDSLKNFGKFNPSDFILEWLPKSVQSINKEIQKLENQIKEQNNTNFLLLKQQKELLVDAKTFILGDSQQNYNSVAIKLELITGQNALNLKKLVKNSIIQTSL